MMETGKEICKGRADREPVDERSAPLAAVSSGSGTANDLSDVCI